MPKYRIVKMPCYYGNRLWEIGEVVDFAEGWKPPVGAVSVETASAVPVAATAVNPSPVDAEQPEPPAPAPAPNAFQQFHGKQRASDKAIK